MSLLPGLPSPRPSPSPAPAAKLVASSVSSSRAGGTPAHPALMAGGPKALGLLEVAPIGDPQGSHLHFRGQEAVGVSQRRGLEVLSGAKGCGLGAG